MVTETNALAVHGLRKSYDDVVAVDGLDLDVRAGECFGLLGPNGAGKTTTIEILEGLNHPDGGEVTVLGRSWKRGEERALRERLGIQLQETRLHEKLSVEETVRLFRSFYRRGPEPAEVLRRVQLEEKRKDKTIAANLSARVAIEADDETIMRRFSETRRPHPLGVEQSIRDSIGAERKKLASIRALADLCIDTLCSAFGACSVFAPPRSLKSIGIRTTSMGKCLSR